MESHSLQDLIDLIGRDWVRKQSDELQFEVVPSAQNTKDCDLEEITL